MKQSILVIIAITANLLGTQSWAAVQAHFDRQQVYSGDTVTLTIEAAVDSSSGLAAGAAPDLSVLESDFRVLGTSQGSQLSIINGQRSESRSWQVSLAPLRSGRIRLDGIAVGGSRSAPLTLEVSELPPAVAQQRAETLFIEMTLGDAAATSDAPMADVVVQQQLPLTVRLFSALPLRDGSLSEPLADDAVIERLGADRQYSAERNGRRYLVIERRYALFAQRSGELSIGPVQFEGSVVDQGRGRDHGRSSGTRADSLFNDPRFDSLFGGRGPMSGFFSDPFAMRDPMAMFAPRQRISAVSPTLNIEVQPRPGGADGTHWLPATSLQLRDSWVERPPQWRAGEPVERTLSVVAVGLAATQLPELQPGTPAGVRVYPGQPRQQTSSDGERVLGVSEQTFTYIPAHGGKFEVPAIDLAWWDTAAKQQRSATLPGWQFSADGPPPTELTSSTAAAAPGSGSGAVDAAALVAESSVMSVSSLAAQVQQAWRAATFEQRLGLAGLLATVLLALGLWRRRSQRRASVAGRLARPGSNEVVLTSTAQQQPSSRRTASAARQSFKKACGGNDPARAAAALLAWASAEWPDAAPRSLGELRRRCESAGPPGSATGTAIDVAPIAALEQVLYAGDASEWQGAALWSALSAGLCLAADRKGERDAPDASQLAPLYPAG